VISPVFLEAFTLTFLAEWGDRSQIATIGLAAQSNVWGVTLGGVFGHGVCTGAAVMAGSATLHTMKSIKVPVVYRTELDDRASQNAPE
jgi:putative Ca2+/H+ antiporter (TMEM165/GDT1 family)